MQKIHIKSIAHVSELTIESSSNNRTHFVITGKNGSGKTMLLNQIDACLSEFKENPDKRDLSNRSISLGFFGEGQDDFHKDFREIIKTSRFIYHYFKAENRWDLGSIKNFAYFITDLMAQNDPRAPVGLKNIQLLDRIIKDFSALLELKEANLKPEGGSLLLQDGDNTYPFEKLPHGYVAVLALYGELLMTAHRQGESSETIEGLVLIDEPELYMDEDMQKNVLPVMIKRFPAIQFVIATHSRDIINSIADAIVYDMGQQVSIR